MCRSTIAPSRPTGRRLPPDSCRRVPLDRPAARSCRRARRTRRRRPDPPTRRGRRADDAEIGDRRRRRVGADRGAAAAARRRAREPRRRVARSAAWRRCGNRAGSRSRSSSTCRRRPCTSATRSCPLAAPQDAHRDAAAPDAGRVRAGRRDERGDDRRARRPVRGSDAAPTCSRSCRGVIEHQGAAARDADARRRTRRATRSARRCARICSTTTSGSRCPTRREIDAEDVAEPTGIATFTRDADDPAQAAKRAARKEAKAAKREAEASQARTRPPAAQAARKRPSTGPSRSGRTHPDRRVQSTSALVASPSRLAE